jgi:hypothetical protein
MKKVLVLLFNVIIVLNAHAQEINKERIVFIENLITKKIVIEYIKCLNNDIKKERLESEGTYIDFNSKMCALNWNQKLSMHISICPEKYPDTSYVLYLVQVDTCISPTGLKYYFSGLNYVLGINKNMDVKYFAGFFRQHDIFEHFNTDIHNPKTFIPYLRLKLADELPLEITFISKMGNDYSYKMTTKKNVVYKVEFNIKRKEYPFLSYFN